MKQISSFLKASKQVKGKKNNKQKLSYYFCVFL